MNRRSIEIKVAKLYSAFFNLNTDLIETHTFEDWNWTDTNIVKEVTPPRSQRGWVELGKHGSRWQIAPIIFQSNNSDMAHVVMEGLLFCEEEKSTPEVLLEDICYGLSHIKRYNGHKPINVAQHSNLCYEIAKLLVPDPHLHLDVITHDFHESILGDMVKPVRDFIPSFELLEAATSFRLKARLFPNWSGNVERTSKAVAAIDRLAFFAEKAKWGIRSDKEWGIDMLQFETCVDDLIAYCDRSKISDSQVCDFKQMTHFEQVSLLLKYVDEAYNMSDNIDNTLGEIT